MAAHDEHDPTETALRAKVARWQTALDAYLAAKSEDGGPPASEQKRAQSNHRAGFDLPVGALRNQTLPEAIKLYLQAGTRKQTNKEIATGIRSGGFESGSTNLDTAIGSALFRLKKAGVVLRFPDGWDLAEHYPEHIRRKFEGASASPGRPKKPRTRRQKAEPAKHADATKSRQASTPNEP
jgi:hypothetical protein